MFDNGASPTAHSQSRAIVVSARTGRPGTATLVAQLTHSPPLVAESQGNVQPLANGDWFVGWGQEPYFSEFSPEGQLLFEAHFPAHDASYRDFRFAWTGTPAHPPAFAFQPGGERQGTVYASWNGATLGRLLAGARGRERTSLQHRRAGATQRLRDRDPGAGGDGRARMWRCRRSGASRAGAGQLRGGFGDWGWVERKGGDSNSRDGGYPPAGFQDRCIQPLCHPSAIDEGYSAEPRSSRGAEQPRAAGRRVAGQSIAPIPLRCSATRRCLAAHTRRAAPCSCRTLTVGDTHREPERQPLRSIGWMRCGFPVAPRQAQSCR